MENCLHGTLLYAELVIWLRRMLFERQVFSSLAKAVFHSTVLFSFHCSLLFNGSSKILCRHKRGTNPQHESLYKKKSTSLQSKIINI